MKRIFLFTGLTLLILFVLFITSLFVFSEFYGDKVTAYVLTELNKQLNVQVKVASRHLQL